MKHKKSKPRSQAWKNSRSGWVPSESTRATWSRQRTGRKATELQRQERSNRLCGSGNPNAVVWDIIDPTGNVIRVTGLRGYCRDNNLPFGWIYHSKNGWKSIKYGTGKGGRRKKV